jgi:hypothetical protein
LTYLTEILQEVWLEAAPGQLLSEECHLKRFVLVLLSFDGVLQIDLLNQLFNEVLVEIFSKL